MMLGGWRLRCYAPVIMILNFTDSHRWTCVQDITLILTLRVHPSGLVIRQTIGLSVDHVVWCIGYSMVM